MFDRPLDHLQVELSRLDLMLHREILRLRSAYALSLDEFRGLYISDEQVDNLVRQTASQNGSTPDVEMLTAQAEAMRSRNAENLPDHFPWVRLLKDFDLHDLEADLLLLALASELDAKYETLFAYLNNDVTRRWPTVDLALRLFSGGSSSMLDVRRALLPEGKLFASGLLRPVPGVPDRPAWLTGGFAAAPVLSHYLLGIPALDLLLQPFTSVTQPGEGEEVAWIPEELLARLHRLPRLFSATGGTLLVFTGREGIGRFQASQVVCAELGLPLLRVDLASALATGASLKQLAGTLALQARLPLSGIYLAHGEALFGEDNRPLTEAQPFLERLHRLPGPLFLALPSGLSWHDLLPQGRSLDIPFPEPDYTDRRRLWSQVAARQGFPLDESRLNTLAGRFAFSPGQIRQAWQSAFDHHLLQEPETDHIQLQTLLDAARKQSDQSLGRLASKVPLVHHWEDLVLPPGTLRQVQEVAAAIQHHARVYEDWGFGQRISAGQGIKVLFSGASGTGKTMTAGVIARHLGLGIYKVDLSGVVSKYIGETEKNLARIFEAARYSNAILFFDEADALFGKRSEVKDSHDRYANIEVAYLLQKMEEHEGPVILASNLSKNIDQAFARRMHYVIEFPLPDEEHRQRLWRGMFPAKAPLDQDVDFPFLARQFAISGGDIRNVALEAAFLAAQDGQVIRMSHLVHALAHQSLKQGKIPSSAEFRQYYGWATESSS